MVAAVLLDLNLPEVVIATVALPTMVWAVPANTVTAPAEDPVLMIDQSNAWFVAIALKPASISVPVGSVMLLATVPVAVIISVSNWAIVKVAVAFTAVGVGC